MSNPQHVLAADLNAQLQMAVRIQDQAEVMFAAVRTALRQARAHTNEIRRRVETSAQAPAPPDAIEVAVPAVAAEPVEASAPVMIGDDELVPDVFAARILGVHPRTLRRWDEKPEAGFPPPVTILKRRYRRGADFNRFRRAGAVTRS
jgi:hypothetical protein